MINGIQQIGIGTTSVEESFRWYRQQLGFNVKVFDEAAEAPLMTRYTGGTVHSRRALLAVNLNGGGGMEIWQFTSRRSADQPPLSLHQLGFLAARIKCRHTAQAKVSGGSVSAPANGPDGKASVVINDPFGNSFIAGETSGWFKQQGGNFGGIEGVLIGVSDMDRSVAYYSNVLGIDKVIYDQTKVFDDLAALEGGKSLFRRVRLEPSNRNTGAFSEVFGHYSVELIQRMDGPSATGRFAGRYWGDQGYIHLCFDVNNMNQLRDRARANGHAFTIDSDGSFSMGEAAGRFAYLEDPDGALIELVETDRITVSKKWGWFLKLTPGRKSKPLPRILFWFMGLNKVKD